MSFQFKLDDREEFVADAIGDVGSKLQASLRLRKAEDGLTQNEIAEKLGVDRSRINKCLSGFNNLTIKTLAELVWAMDGKLKIDIVLNNARSEADDTIQTSKKRNTVTDLKPIHSEPEIAPSGHTEQKASRTTKTYAF